MILSIIVPVYKVEAYVERCLCSCIDQDITVSEYEIVVINDGSPDGSLDIVSKIAESHSNIKIISQENAGLSAARNTGINAAVGKYLMFLDSDDWLTPNSLGKLVAQLKYESPDALAFCAADSIDGGLRRRMAYPITKQRTGREHLLLGINYCTNATFTIWNAAFLNDKKLRFYEGIFHEDSEFTPRAFYLARKISYANDIVYNVTINKESITRSVNPKRSFDLVEVVTHNLYDFSLSLPAEDKLIFDQIISVCVNSALNNIVTLPEDYQKKLNDSIRSKKYLLSSLFKSRRLKYMIESVLFRLFPKYIVRIYKKIKSIMN